MIQEHRTARSRLLLALLAALGALLLGASSASAITYGVDVGRGNGEYTQVEHLGATVFRFPLDKTHAPTGEDWSFYNSMFEEAWQHGITMQPILIRSIGESTPFPTSGEYAGWNDWVKKAIGQYGPNGAFWNGKANPRPVTSWEVWNEENLVGNNPGGTTVQPENYARFLISTSNAIKAVQPGASVLFGGLYLPGGRFYRSFLEEASKVSGEPNAFSAIAIHPYAFINKITELEELVKGARSAANAFGGFGKPLVINEFGWPTEFEQEKVPTVSEEQQATLLRQGFDWIKGHAVELNISSVYWFNMRDDNLKNKWDHRCGLRRNDGGYRPAWTAFQEEAGAPVWGAPAAETRPATEVTESRAKLNGWVHPHNLPTTYYFDYGTTTAYGYSVPAPHANTDGSIGVWVNATVNGLQPGTRYYYRLVAVNEMGTFVTAASSFRTPQTYVAFQANTNKLWTYTTAGGYFFNTTLGMSSTTTPSIAGAANGGYVAAFQSDRGQLWTYSSESGYHNTELGMMPGTSPSIALEPNGSYVVAFQANTGTLWTYTSAGGYFANTTLGMQPGTSPSIATRSDAGYVIAFQTNTGQLWTYASGVGYWSIGLGMAPGTSPSIAMQPDNNWVIALESNTEKLWTFSSANGYSNTELGMQPGTSPSIEIR